MRTPSLSPEVAGLLSRGRKIAAIKRHREETGVGLLEAKRAVEAGATGVPMRGYAPSAGTEPRPGSGRSAAFLAATILGLVTALITGVGLTRAHLASSWEPVEAEVVSARLVDDYSHTAPSMEIEFEFNVGGEPYRGTRVSFTPVWGGRLTKAVRERYPVGARPTVYYDADNPNHSVAETRVPLYYSVLFLLSVAILGWGIREWVAAAGREKQLRSEEPWPRKSEPATGTLS